MWCPFCKNSDSRVIDSRSPGEGFIIRRRRECLACKRRFTTYERIEQKPLKAVKKDGTRVPYDREKILSGLRKACQKRPVSEDAIEEVAAAIEVEAHEQPDGEVSTAWIGERIMHHLRGLDQVAYVRFASVYRAFQDVSDFVTEVRPMLEPGHPPVRVSEGSPSRPLGP